MLARELGPIDRMPLAPEMWFTLRMYGEGDLPREFWLSDEQWERLQPLLPNKPRGLPRVDARRVISGIVHVLQAGCWSRSVQCGFRESQP